MRAPGSPSPAIPALLLCLLALALFVPGLWSLPVTDRDEARFAQASRQMVESGDYIAIRFHDEARNKKPVGIHWLQTASLHGANALGIEADGKAWVYRLPSVLGGLLAMLALFLAARPRLGASGAGLAAMALGSSLLLGVEARIAKTDAMLLATIVVMQGALLAAYGLRRDGAPVPLSLALLFWLAMAAGILIKGPLAPMIALLCLASLAIADRRQGLGPPFGGSLRPWIGLGALAGLALPWFLLTAGGEQGFVMAAFREDLLPKLIGGHESHGAPPGFYLAALPFTFWPAVLFLPFALICAWRRRKDPLPRFALAWALPAWIVFELVPTKLVHYVLPLYPALALLIGWAVVREGEAVLRMMRSLPGMAWIGLWLLAGLLLGGLVPGAAWWFGWAIPAGAWAGLALALAMGLAGILLAGAGRLRASIMTLSLLMVPFMTAVLHASFPALPLWPSAAAQALAKDAGIAPGTRMAVAGFREPSIIFAFGTETRLTSASGAADHLAAADDAAVLIHAEGVPPFLDAMAQHGKTAVEAGRITAFNTARGREVTLVLFHSEALSHPDRAPMPDGDR